ncbi:MAG: cation-translocating P-type ATPase [bacterium]|nr:cation-translocating P-type ATPase [bacterium]
MPHANEARPDWHASGADAVARELGVDLDEGLSHSTAADRLERHGSNELSTGRRRTLLRIVLAQFSDFMIVVLLVAAVVSGVVGEPQDAIAILVILAVNAAIGAAQEHRAEEAIAALRQMAAPIARVKRGGAWIDASTAELVPGDVVGLEAGDVVGADVRLVSASGLRIDEAPLTGESQPIDKQSESLASTAVPLAERANMAFAGTLVTAGRAEAIVTATGAATELGRIAGLLEQAGVVKTPLQRRLTHFGRRLALAVLAICAALFFAGLARGEPRALMFLTAVTLAVAAIPEALPAVVSVSLALGARKMSRRKALVRKLAAVESLGSVTYICTDKTGTLTQNRMRVEVVFAGGERREELPPQSAAEPWNRLARAMTLNNDASPERGDPTEVALLAAAAAAGYTQPELERTEPRIGEIAFDGDRRRMTTVHATENGRAVVLVKGAPEVVLARCGAADRADREAALRQAEQLAQGGFRVLAFAGRELEQVPHRIDAKALETQLDFLGLAALADPPRPEAADAVRLCKQAGITPVMITGDHAATAWSIACRLGVADEAQGRDVVTGDELEELSQAELAVRVRTARVYARISPEQKLAIVRTLQEGGEYVAMTGDGVNDAPALKRAEIGVAMGLQGTEVAREAADIVLLDDNFSTIVAAVREGRRVFDNVRKFVKYTMTSNSGEIWTLSIAPLLGLPIPLLPIQILWINLVTDGLPGLALAAEPEERDVMERPPRPPGESLFAGGMAFHIVCIGLLIAGLSIASQAWAIGRGSENWQSVVFTVLTFSQLAHALVIRSEKESLFSRGLRSNLALIGSIALTTALQLAVLYVPALARVLHTSPLTCVELGLCFASPVVVVAAAELEKWLVRRGVLYRKSRRT